MHHYDDEAMNLRLWPQAKGQFVALSEMSDVHVWNAMSWAAQELDWETECPTILGETSSDVVYDTFRREWLEFWVAEFRRELDVRRNALQGDTYDGHGVPPPTCQITLDENLGPY